MKVTVRLVGTTPGKPQDDREVFSLSSADGKNMDHMQRVFNHIKTNCTILGLRFGLAASGVITFKAEKSQLRPEVVAEVRRVAEEALRLI